MIHYRLGYYNTDGKQVELARLIRTEEEAKEKFNSLRKTFQCTIWVEKVEFIDTDSWRK